ncbi:PREDICTED: LOW QUALITY PROTEIN: uncharacterized protein LOC108770700 [Trachymyrmex cornetzi]|uniref:LOW QUALITY PROTEIN: uncharacterized protein LOC108770700 n=1 Tax=Trachymyrmex cornetzi TaxID=471704 RepID=UPI00084EEE66|nr:PREDICTED: LOW QUALITY PROTEIN: uncharacterized protein LOC108770700 [Trachymyrmex cornetzi]
MKKPILYKVETYIVPGTENLSIINEIDDLKITNQFDIKSENVMFENSMQNEKNTSFASNNKYEETTRFSTKDSTLIGIKLVKGITNENNILRDEHLDNDIIKYYNEANSCRSNERVQKTEFQASIGSQESLYPAKQFSKTNCLMSIDERNENSLDSKLSNFCRHGYKNGCTASIPSPEEVSEEIFRENWLHKIEILRNREIILWEKEINLQKRERELFRKKEELRITERLLNDKMKQVEQQLKYQKDMIVEKTLEQAAQILYDIEKPDNLVEEKILRKDDVSKKEDILKKEKIPKKEEIPKKEVVLRKEEIPKKEEISKKEEIPRKTEIPKKIEILKQAEIPKNLQPIINPCEKKEEKKKYLMRPNSSLRKSLSSKTHSYATIRYKERSRMNYDDLNSSLSAASIDTSNIRTTELFNPMLHKKPYAFTRSASERWTRHKSIPGKLQKVAEEKPEHIIKEEKIFQKFSDNICALQEKETRFQNYGPVDCIPDIDILSKAEHNNKDKLSSYLNLETDERYSHRDQASTSKDRPVSWTSETDKWVQKHQMYNSATKQSIENKENIVCNKPIMLRKKQRETKKKSKKFPLFR